MALRIDYLDEHLDAVPTLARWHHDEWATITPHLSVADRIVGFRARAQRGMIPTGFVAAFDAEVVGLACLVECDIGSHAHLTPWLASVLVAPHHRGRGIGAALCERAVEEARTLHVPNVYLFTFDKQDFYARRGWSDFQMASYAGRCGTIMVRMLTS